MCSVNGKAAGHVLSGKARHREVRPFQNGARSVSPVADPSRVRQNAAWPTESPQELVNVERQQLIDCIAVVTDS
jgi:hypothetical protein